MNERPVVAILTYRWESQSEAGWVTRQVAGAMACRAEVHVITPEGDAPSRRADSVFTVHQMATARGPKPALRRALLIEAISATRSDRRGRLVPALGALLDEDLLDIWDGASSILKGLHPDIVVIAGHELVGAMDAADRALPAVPMVLLPLGDDPNSLAFPHFDRVFDRCETVLAITETERLAVIACHGRPDQVHRVGVPLAANPSVLDEPNTWVGTTDYIFVHTGVTSQDHGEAAGLARLLRLRFPETPVGISATDKFGVWHQGRSSEGWPIERSSDIFRLMAWARVVVDLRPGPLFARRCVESLLYGTPIVVPGNSPAREHAELGRGGLWFDTPGELTWCVEALLAPEVRSVFSSQGQSYAEERFGSTDRFIERILRSTGIVPAVTS